MYRKLVVIMVALAGGVGALAWLGWRAVEMHAEGLAGRRLGDFAQTAELIRRDVKRKVEGFVEREQQRPYTDYQYYFVPENVAQTQQEAPPVLVSPLRDRLENDLAYGYFQIQADGTVQTPYGPTLETAELGTYVAQVREDLGPVLEGRLARVSGHRDTSVLAKENESASPRESGHTTSERRRTVAQDVRPQSKVMAKTKSSRRGGKGAPRQEQRQMRSQIALDNEVKTQVLQQARGNTVSNLYLNRDSESQQLKQIDQVQMKELTQRTTQAAQQVAQAEPMHEPQLSSEEAQVAGRQERASRAADQQPNQMPNGMPGMAEKTLPMPQGATPGAPAVEAPGRSHEVVLAEQQGGRGQRSQQALSAPQENETVEIRIDQLPPVVVDSGGRDGILGADVYLLREVRIESERFLQGFRLNTAALEAEVRESASRLVGEGMRYSVEATEAVEAGYTAFLDFGFGELAVNLFEADAAWQARQVAQLRTWYFGTVAVVFLVVSLAGTALGRNLYSHVKLARQKDDFISAVSHELRTPLTSIRMYTEMLDKDWIKTEDKRRDYYRNMRQESERLSRLIENVLDFSRLARGRKQFDFQVGCLNDAVTTVIEMMAPYAAQRGFTIQMEPGELPPVAFDKDAVMQIVVNLVDNAVKYAASAAEKTIVVRTRPEADYVLLEVEDRGPGVEHRQRKKIFDTFYRGQDENRRETTGTGLGLALVKRFADAHGGFVDVRSARPSGSVFRVGLAARG